jgi:hypothetical protein
MLALFAERQTLLMNMAQAKGGQMQAEQMMSQLGQQMQAATGQQPQLPAPEEAGGAEEVTVPNPEELLTRAPESPGAPVETIYGEFNPSM